MVGPFFDFPSGEELKADTSCSSGISHRDCPGEMCMIAPLKESPIEPKVSLILLGAAVGSIASSVRELGISPTLCRSTNEAVAALKRLPYQAILCDLKLPGADKFMRDVRNQFPSVALLVFTQPGDLRGGILATLSGASGYIQAPLNPQKLTAVLHSALERKRLESAILSSVTQ
jgi:CheY-like chemotaxis protein